MTFNVALVKDVIPYIAWNDKRWKQFKKENFNSG